MVSLFGSPAYSFIQRGKPWTEGGKEVAVDLPNANGSVQVIQ